MNVEIIVLILLLSFISEIWTVKYMKKATDGNAFHAAVYSGLLVLASAVAIICYVEDPLYLIPDAVGTIAGTYYAVKQQH